MDLSLNKTRDASLGDCVACDDEGEMGTGCGRGSRGAIAGDVFDLGQLRSKSSANRSSLLTGAAGASTPCTMLLSFGVGKGGPCASADCILYCRPSPNSITPSKKLSSSSSIYQMITLLIVLYFDFKTTNLIPMVGIWI